MNALLILIPVTAVECHATIWILVTAAVVGRVGVDSSARYVCALLQNYISHFFNFYNFLNFNQFYYSTKDIVTAVVVTIINIGRGG